MNTNTAKKQNSQKGVWKPFFNMIFRAKLPWIWYLVNILIGLVFSEISVQIPRVAGEIMNGNIFDKALVGTYAWTEITMLLIGIPTAMFSSWISMTVDRRLRHFVWGRFVRLPMRTIDTVNPSALPSRITSDITATSNTIDYFISLFNLTYMFGRILMIVYGLSPKLMIPLILMVPYIMFATVICGRIQFKVDRRTQNVFAKFMNYVTEGLNNLRLIKSSGADELEIQRGMKVAHEAFEADLYAGKMAMISGPLRQTITSFIEAFLVIYGGILISHGEMESGDMVTMMMYLSTISGLSVQYTQFWGQLKGLQGATARVSELTAVQSETMERERGFDVPDEDIVFQDVDFAYDDKNVLQDVSFTIPKGKTTAIVGPSGSGKTTTLSLLERFYQPNDGQILFGKEKVERFHLNEWRRAMGYVPQLSPLLSGTIRENLNYGLDQPATDAELVKAAKIANIYDFIQTLPEGFDTEVGQIGGKMSGGERQRIAIARTAIKNPDILLLDEATSNLDPQNAAEVQAALANLMQGRTSVIVAHSMSTVKRADHIVVLNQGRVEAEGTHQELYKSNELYHNYCDLQLGAEQ